MHISIKQTLPSYVKARQGQRRMQCSNGKWKISGWQLRNEDHRLSPPPRIKNRPQETRCRNSNPGSHGSLRTRQTAPRRSLLRLLANHPGVNRTLQLLIGQCLRAFALFILCLHCLWRSPVGRSTLFLCLRCDLNVTGLVSRHNDS